MKHRIATILFFVMISMISFGYAQEEAQEPVAQQEPAPEKETAPPPEEVSIGNIYFPRPFIQAGKEYQKGVYTVKILYKESGPVFAVYKKDSMLFEEIAIQKKKNNRVKRFKVRRDFLKNFEFFRIRVFRPDHNLYAYFLTKQKAAAPEAQTAPEQNPEAGIQ